MLILDEATSSVDAESERLIQQALRTLMAERTCLIVGHRLSSVRIADRVFRVDEDGSVREIPKNELAFWMSEDRLPPTVPLSSRGDSRELSPGLPAAG